MKHIDKKASIFKALSEPLRLKIIEYLMKNEKKCICDVAITIDRDQSVAYRHIQILKRNDIVSTEKIDKHLMCMLKNKDKVKKILEAIE